MYVHDVIINYFKDDSQSVSFHPKDFRDEYAEELLGSVDISHSLL